MIQSLSNVAQDMQSCTGIPSYVSEYTGRICAILVEEAIMHERGLVPPSSLDSLTSIFAVDVTEPGHGPWWLAEQQRSHDPRNWGSFCSVSNMKYETSHRVY